MCDIDGRRARALAGELDVPHVFSSLTSAAESREFDYAHVLVPPDLHLSVARELTGAGVGVLVEKPLGLASADCAALTRDAGAQVGVNHNAVFFPAYLQLREQVLAGTFGPLRHVAITLSYPRAAMPGPEHWALRSPENLMYEAGVHPLSQIYDLAGPLVSAKSVASGRRDLGARGHCFDTWQVSLECARATAQLFLSYGGGCRTWQLTAVCEDGILAAELEQNRFSAISPTRWGPSAEPLNVALRLGSRELGQGFRNMGTIARTVIQPSVARDPYFMSMSASIAAFHAPEDPKLPVVDGAFGTAVVAMCEAITREVSSGGAPRRSPRREAAKECDVVVLGGTGFIGRAVVEQLLAGGATVRVMARNMPVAGPGDPLAEADFVAGDVAELGDVDRAVTGARTVIHLAHGGRFTWEEVTSSMIEAADLVASACLAHRVERLLYTGTIASLYLGDPEEIITGVTPTDPRARERGPYEWGKAESEAVLRRRYQADGLPVTILRPGVVLGAGGTPFHSGFGEWRGGVHCVGWNAGNTPLPLVLATDVAAAIVRAIEPQAPVGRSFNVVGDVRLTARECVAFLREATRRPLVFHPRHPLQHEGLKAAKWTVRTLTGSRAPFPSYRGVKSMGCSAQFDCTDLKQSLGWEPMAGRGQFIENSLRVHQAVRTA